MGLWAAYRALSGIRAFAVNAGIALAILAALYSWHILKVHGAYNRGYAAAVAAQKAATARDEAGATGPNGVGNKSFQQCERDVLNGKNVHWNRDAQKCEKNTSP